MQRGPVGSGEDQGVVVGRQTVAQALAEDIDQLRVETDQAPAPRRLGLADDEAVVDGYEAASDRGRARRQIDIRPAQGQSLPSSDPGQEVEEPEAVVGIGGGVTEKQLELRG
jgi:hypothetical protein